MLRRIWLFSANKIKSSESFSKHPTQLIFKLNSSLQHINVTLSFYKLWILIFGSPWYRTNLEREFWLWTHAKFLEICIACGMFYILYNPYDLFMRTLDFALFLSNQSSRDSCTRWVWKSGLCTSFSLLSNVFLFVICSASGLQISLDKADFSLKISFIQSIALFVIYSISPCL